MQYPAPGAPELAERVASLLGNAGIPVRFDPDRGLDHGAWIPLYKMYPEASVPVTQLSIAASAGPEIHYAIGRALHALRDEGVLILGSGAITHNFGWIDWDAMEDAPPLRKAKVFADWVAKQLADRDAQSLMKYKAVPYGLESHPSEDHFMPLFVTLGAAENEIPKRFQPNFAYGGLAMDAYYWDGAISAL
jgi:4,5-DOPA dioxygenase extradiol